MTTTKSRPGFTLLELLVVVAILVILAGGLIVAYEGIETSAAKGQVAYSIGALDGAMRNYKGVNKRYPDLYDSLLFVDGTNYAALNVLPVKLRGDGTGTAKVGPYVLTAEAVAALNEAGVTSVRDVSSAVSNIEFGTYNNALVSAGGTQPEQPSRVFDDPNGEGFGVTRTLAAGQTVVALNGLAVADFDGDTPTNDGRANKVANLPSNVAHIVVAFGVGNNCTLIDKTGAGKAVLSEAPSYGNNLPTEYDRLLVLFLVATDSDGDGAIQTSEYLPVAQFLGVTATDVDHRDEESNTSGL